MTTETARVAACHELIRSDIIRGRWIPGQKLRAAVLADTYGTSTTVIREALTRLAGEKFLVIEPNRGFSVPALSLPYLRDLTEVRCRSDGLALELAIERGDLKWESDLMAAHYQLSKIPRRREDDPELVAPQWVEAHHAFHATLLRGCDVPLLIALARELSDSTELYRRWAATTQLSSSRDVEAEHQAILEATLARDAPLATRLLREHYERTVAVILAGGLLAHAPDGSTRQK